MKTIVMLTCSKAGAVCTGARCFRAFYGRTHQFARYGDEPIQVVAFMKCGGCGHDLEKDKGLQEKMETILRLAPDAVHLGICCCHDGKDRALCDEVKELETVFASHGINVIHGTHTIF